MHIDMTVPLTPTVKLCTPVVVGVPEIVEPVMLSPAGNDKGA